MTYLLPTVGGLTIRGIGRGTGIGGGALSKRCDLSSRSCMSLIRSSIRDLRRRRARRSISRVDATYELSVTRKAEETWMSCITISGGMALASSSGIEGGGSSLIFILNSLICNYYKKKRNAKKLHIKTIRMKNAYWQVASWENNCLDLHGWLYSFLNWWKMCAAASVKILALSALVLLFMQFYWL